MKIFNRWLSRLRCLAANPSPPRSISLPGTNQKSPILRLLLRLIPQHLMREVVYLYCIPVLPLYRIPLLKSSHRTTCWYLPQEVTYLSVCNPSSLQYGRHRTLKPLTSAMYLLGTPFLFFCEIGLSYIPPKSKKKYQIAQSRRRITHRALLLDSSRVFIRFFCFVKSLSKLL
ncbi:hypothetical protein BZA70DRAFT_23298 [Myxozyma melibiosi]|uniref:Uncharacterized protein n=1 Tax=Myxozyma melibiosi TaxID=54550 RepID=A0ABR1FCZ6_9ASCO